MQGRIVLSAVLASLAIAFFAGAVVFGLFGDDDQIASVPQIGETAATFLADGTPIFVVHGPDGQVHVIEAVSAHIPADAMGWCARTRTFEDAAHGAKWDERGRYLAGPASSDLGSFETSLSDGQVIVGKYVPALNQSDPGWLDSEMLCASLDLEMHPAPAS